MAASGTHGTSNTDLDVNLIMLYSKCEAFYNKRHPYYRDKVYTEQAWVHISQKLGYKGIPSYILRYKNYMFFI